MKFGAIEKIGLAVAMAGLMAGCADSGFGLSTASLSQQPTTQVAQKNDSVCMALAAQINALRGDGSIERLEKAAAGKTAKVEVKRTSLQKQADLNKANADFLTRCGPAIPAQAAAAPMAPQAPVVTKKTASAAPASNGAIPAPMATDAN